MRINELAVQQSLKNNPLLLKRQKIEKVAEDFETIFVKMMFEKMNQTLDESFFGSSTGFHIYQGMFEEKFSEFVTQNDSLGIKEQIRNYMLENLSANGVNIKQIESAVEELDMNFEHMEKKAQNKINVHASQVRARMRSPENFSPIIKKASEIYEVPEKLITAVIRAESAGNPNAVSKAGAKGLMQLMDRTADSLGVKNSFDPKENILGGTKYLKKLLNQFDGEIEMALAAYNAGPSRVRKYNGIPPFKETQNYVNKIMNEIRRG
jgi:Rod binding domain-containing protein